MKKKHVFYEEISYFIGIVLLACGAALMEKAKLGISMVVAPAYLIYLKVSQYLDFFTFGMAEYMLQAVLLVAMIAVLRKFKWSYLFSFVTAVFYGVVLDLFMKLMTLVQPELLDNGLYMLIRILLFSVGMVVCAFGVALVFHTYVSPEVYELFVKEVTSNFHLRMDRFKTIYDCSSCLVAVILSFVFFGFLHFEGVKIGTIICALLNGKLIGILCKVLEKKFEFKPFLKIGIKQNQQEKALEQEGKTEQN